MGPTYCLALKLSESCRFGFQMLAAQIFGPSPQVSFESCRNVEEDWAMGGALRVQRTPGQHPVVWLEVMLKQNKLICFASYGTLYVFFVILLLTQESLPPRTVALQAV